MLPTSRTITCSLAEALAVLKLQELKNEVTVAVTVGVFLTACWLLFGQVMTQDRSGERRHG